MFYQILKDTNDSWISKKTVKSGAIGTFEMNSLDNEGRIVVRFSDKKGDVVLRLDPTEVRKIAGFRYFGGYNTILRVKPNGKIVLGYWIGIEGDKWKKQTFDNNFPVFPEYNRKPTKTN